MHKTFAPDIICDAFLVGDMIEPTFSFKWPHVLFWQQWEARFKALWANYFTHHLIYPS